MRNVLSIPRPSFGWLAVITLLLLPVFTSSGAVDMFLKLSGIKGESLDSEHKDSIEVLSWSWGASNSGTTHSGAGSGSGKPTVQDINITKYIDRASPALLLNTMNGKQISTGELIVRRGGMKPSELLKIELKDILVTSITTGGSEGADRLTENVTLNFGKYRLTYTPQNPDGSKGTPVVVEWDITAETPTF